MSPTPPLKRRRLETASSTLAQPFKSPFKTAQNTHQTVASAISVTESAGSIPTPTTSKATHQPSPPLPKPIHTPYAEKTANPSPALSALQKKHTALLGTLAATRANLETLTQAQKLETSSTDQELEALIREWTVASRAAAEEVFEGVKERVDRMGGVRSWKAIERDKRNGSGWGWEEEKKGSWEEEDGRETRKDCETKGEREEREEREGSDGESGGRIQENDEDEEFTMDMMLQSLNIDLRIIGYSKDLQNWID